MALRSVTEGHLLERLSLMTMSFGRTHHARESIPRMLEAMDPLDELVVADLGPDRELTDFLDRIPDKRITHVMHMDCVYYHPAHARNLCLRHAWGDRVLSFDCDVFPSASMLELCRTQDVNVGYISSRTSKNYGFISVPRWVAVAVQGWEEALTGHTHDDMQFRSAVRSSGVHLEHIKIDVESVDVSVHPRHFQNMNIQMQSAVNGAVAKNLRRLDPVLNNCGRAWGTGGIIRRRSELSRGTVQGNGCVPLPRRAAGWPSLVTRGGLRYH